MKYFPLLALLLVSLAAKSQINAEDNSVQVIGYWDKNEKHTYGFISEKASVKGNDTIITESISYKVDITVVDSTAKSYTLQWKYYDVAAKTENKVAEKLAKLNEGLVVKFTTDEYGAFNQLLNWEDIKKHNEKAVKLLEKESSATIRQTVVALIKDKYKSREAIERHTLKEILQFYTFNGIGLKKGEVIEEDITEENPITKSPMKSHMKVELYDVNVEDSDYILKFWQTFDKGAIAPLVTEMFRDLIGNDAKKITEFVEDATLNDYYITQFHNTGWPISSYFERSIKIKTSQNLETREVELLD